jgi:hypothetical protein
MVFCYALNPLTPCLFPFRMNFTFLTNPVWSEAGPGIAVAGTMAASCTGGVVAASAVAILFGGLAIGGWTMAILFRRQRDALRGPVELVRRHQRAASSIQRMLDDFEEAASVSAAPFFGPTPNGGVRLPPVPVHGFNSSF